MRRTDSLRQWRTIAQAAAISKAAAVSSFASAAAVASSWGKCGRFRAHSLGATEKPQSAIDHFQAYGMERPPSCSCHSVKILSPFSAISLPVRASSHLAVSFSAAAALFLYQAYPVLFEVVRTF